MSQGSPLRSGRRRVPHDKQVRWAIGVTACFLPMIGVGLSPASSNASLVYIGLLPSLTSVLLGFRVVTAAALATPVVVLIGLLLSGTPWAGTLYMVAIGAGVAWSWRKGWQVPATYVASQAALAVVAAPHSSLAADVPANQWVSSLTVTGFVLLGGGWVIVVDRVLLSDLPPHPAETDHPPDVRRFATTLCLLLGVFTFAAMTRYPGSNALWVLLTVLVVLQPDVDQTRTRALFRVGGTVLGGLAAAVVVNVVHNSAATNLLGLVLGVASAAAFIKAPYWVFTTTLTAAVICLTFTADTAAHGAAQRLAFTLAAAAAVLLIGLAGRWVVPHNHRRLSKALPTP